MEQLSLLEQLGPPNTVDPNPATFHKMLPDENLRILCRVCHHKRNREGDWDPDWDVVAIDALGNWTYEIYSNDWQLAKRYPSHIWIDEWPNGGGENERAKRLQLKGLMSAYWTVEKAVNRGEYGSFTWKGESIL